MFHLLPTVIVLVQICQLIRGSSPDLNDSDKLVQRMAEKGRRGTQELGLTTWGEQGNGVATINTTNTNTTINTDNTNNTSIYHTTTATATIPNEPRTKSQIDEEEFSILSKATIFYWNQNVAQEDPILKTTTEKQGTIYDPSSFQLKEKKLTKDSAKTNFYHQNFSYHPYYSGYKSERDTICTPEQQALDGLCRIPYMKEYISTSSNSSEAKAPDISDECMLSYEENRVEVKLTKGYAASIDKANLLWFDPEPALRKRCKVYLIQALGTEITVQIGDERYRVLPVWLRTGKVVCFYRTSNSLDWILAQELYSSTKDCPFSNVSMTLGESAGYGGVLKKYNQDLCGSLVVERAVQELHALNIVSDAPATCTVNDWKELIALVGWRDMKINPEVSLNLNLEFAAQYKVYTVPSLITQGILLPKRNTNLASRLYNGIATYARIVDKVTHGSFPACYPGLFTLYTDVLNHSLLIPDGCDSEHSEKAFYKMFGGLLKYLRKPVPRSMADDYYVGATHPTDLCESAGVNMLSFPATADSTVTGIVHNPLLDLDIIRKVIEYYSTWRDNQSGLHVLVHMLYTMLAYRCAVLMTMDQGTWINAVATGNKSHKIVYEAAIKQVRDDFVAEYNGFLPSDVTSGRRALSLHDVFRAYARVAIL